MDALSYRPSEPSRLRLLLDRFSRIEDKRSPEGVAHPLNEILLLCVCATIADCDSFDAIAAWGQAQLGFLRRFLPFEWGIPTARWLNIMMNRIDPELFGACFMDWVRACWPDPLDTIAFDGKTVRRSHDRANGRAALHLVCAFATNSRLVLGQEAVDGKSNETTAIPVLLEKLAASRSLEGAVVTIDAIACNPQIARSIRDAGADYLLASVSVLRQVDWLDGDRRFPGEIRFPDARAIVKVEARTELKDRSRFDARYYIASSDRSAARLATAIRGHWGIENPLHWTLDVTFQEDLARVRKGHGAQNMALVRKFAINKLRAAPPPRNPPGLPIKPCRRPTKPPRPPSLKLRRKMASWNVDNLADILIAQPT